MVPSRLQASCLTDGKIQKLSPDCPPAPAVVGAAFWKAEMQLFRRPTHSFVHRQRGCMLSPLGSPHRIRTDNALLSILLNKNKE